MARPQLISAFGVGAALLASSSLARAQSVPPVVPQSALPTRQEVNPAQPDTAAPKSDVKVHEEGAVRSGPCPLAQSDVKVAIRQIAFSGPKGASLAPEIQQLLQGISAGNDAQPIAQVCALRDEANARLQRARYVAAVQIPPQTIDNGVLRLEVVTGRIVEVRVHGDAGPFEKRVRERIEQLKRLAPLNAAQAERILLQANDTPGLSIQMGLSPDTTSGTPGDLIGDLSVSYRRFAVIANVQNYNSKALGRETLYLRAEAYDLLGLDDRTYVAGSTTFDFKKQKTVQFGEQIALNSNNDHISFVSTYALSRPALASLDLRTTSLIEDLAYDHNFVHSTTTILTASGGFEYAEQLTKVYFGGSSVPLNRDRISTLFARVDADKRVLRFDGSQKAEFSGSLELRKGIAVFGSTPSGTVDNGYTPSRFYGSATPFVVRAHANGDIGFGQIFELASQLQGQWANREVLNYDEFAIGNLTVGRGYDPGANTSDRAFAAANEARFNLPLWARVRTQVYGFYDHVRLWNLDPYSTERNRTLRSVGAGARVTLINGLRLDLLYAHPLDPPLLTGTNVQRAPDRVMFSLTAQLVPFGIKF